MRILFINKYDTTGGAAIAARRLAAGLKEYHNTENYFLAGIKRSDNPAVFETRKAGFQNFAERGVNYLFNTAGLQYKWFPFSTKTILKKAEELKPDIISLHNLHGGYFKTSLLTELSQIAPLYWTLHDMWAITGNAAHTYGDESWKKMKGGPAEHKLYPSTGFNNGSWLLKQKKEIYEKSNLRIITPSKWLYNLALQSPVFANKKIVHINNGVDLAIFKPIEKIKTRKELNIPADSSVLIFGAENIFTNEYKGGTELIRIIKKLNTAEGKFHLVVIGRGDLSPLKKYKNLSFQMTGYINDEKLMAKYLSAADLMIYPSRADNLPNALVEAIACGTPAVSYNVGGCGEIIHDSMNGLLVAPSNAADFTDKVLSLINDNDRLELFRISARKLAEKDFSLQKMSESYYRFFSEDSPI